MFHLNMWLSCNVWILKYLKNNANLHKNVHNSGVTSFRVTKCVHVEGTDPEHILTLTRQYIGGQGRDKQYGRQSNHDCPNYVK